MKYLEELAQKQEIKKQSGSNYTVVHSGPFSSLDDYELKHPLRDKPVTGKLFIDDGLPGEKKPEWS